MHLNRKYKYEYILICNYIWKLRYFSPNLKYPTIFNMFSSCYSRNICNVPSGKYRQRLLINLYDHRNILNFWLFESFICISVPKSDTIIPPLQKKKNQYKYQGGKILSHKAKVTGVWLRNVHTCRKFLKYNFIWWLTCNNNNNSEQFKPV